MRSSSSTAEASCSCCSTSLDRARRSIGFALADGLIAPVRVDYRAIGLEGFGKPEGFLGRQVDRWLQQLKSYASIYRYRGRHIHGTPARLAAIIDWALSTIGDPLLDLGWLLFPLRRHGSQDVPAGSYFTPVTFRHAKKSPRTMRKKTERDLSNISYYVALAPFKLACIVEAKVARASIGQDPPAFGKQFSRMVLGLVEDAEKIARSTRL